MTEGSAAPDPGESLPPEPQPGRDAAERPDPAVQDGAAAPGPIPGVLVAALENLWLVWLVTALVLLIRKITIYQSFARYIRAGRVEVSDVALLDRLAQIAAQAGVNRPVELYTNALISSPLLIGFFRPCIVLPDAGLPDRDFQYTILHELTHYRRRDMFYKWLVQLAVCVHWFNPFVYLMSREIGRACELSCDEEVIRGADREGRRAYGDTLVNAMGAGGSYRDGLASITLNESKERLKERLSAIMNDREKTKAAKAAALAFALLLAAGATAVGSYAAQRTPAGRPVGAGDGTAGSTAPSHADGQKSSGSLPAGYTGVTFEEVPPARTQPVRAMEDLDAEEVRAIVLTAESCGIEVVRSESGRFTFDYLGIDDPAKAAVGCDLAGGVLEVTVDGSAARAAASGRYYIDSGPDYVNVVRIGIPERAYETIRMTLDGAPVTLPDLDAAVTIRSEDGTVTLSDEEISRGTYSIENASGGVLIAAGTISSEITVAGDGECELILDQAPENLGLDLSGSVGQILLPEGWTKTQRVGTGAPVIQISNHGYTAVSIDGAAPRE